MQINGGRSDTGMTIVGKYNVLMYAKPNKALQLTAQSAAALRVPSAAFGCSGGN